MKQKYAKLILTICLFSMSFFSFSQTVKQVKEIQKKTNVVQLKTLEKKFKQQQLREKEKALTLAQVNGWRVTYTENGSYYELMKVSENNKPIYYKTDNVAAAISTRANWLHNGGGLGLDVEGQGMTAYVWDGGLARGTHQEYDGTGGDNRFSIGDGTTTLNFHGAHVTGTIIASGVNASAKGMAPQANGVGHDWTNDIAEATAAAANGMLLSNHSYGFGASSIPDSWFGAYLGPARDWDELMYNAPFYLQVNSAGNDGSDNSSNGDPLGGNVSYDKISGRKTSKNSIVVANGQDASINASGDLNSVTRNAGSSEGPTDDLRIKPDIMGNGSGLFSTFEDSDNSYGSLTGTSMASPNVTGSLLLLQQHYNNLNGSFMRAATLKGLALHTADDSGATGPDAQVGWGLMNTKKGAETITKNGSFSLISELVLAQGESYTITVRSDQTNPLLASISWTDQPGALSSGVNDGTAVLVNDLDIRVTQSTDTFDPWKLTSVSTNEKGDNTVDPFERVDVDGATGDYTITVSHKGTLLDGPQNFSLIVTGVESDFLVTALNGSQKICSDLDAVYDFDYSQNISTTTNFTVQNLPTGATANLSVPSLNANGSFTLTLSDLENVTAGTYEIDIVGDNGSESQTRRVELKVFHSDFSPYPSVISYPANAERGVTNTVILRWEENLNAESYDLEVSENPSFTNILASGASVTDLSFTVANLNSLAIYYWRIKPKNECASGDFSQVYSFQTGGEDCSSTYSATDFTNAEMVTFEPNFTAFVPIEITDDLLINRLIVSTDIAHTDVSELTISVEEPEGLGSNTTTLLLNPCDDTDNVTSAIFDDNGPALVCSTTDPAVTGTILPVQSLGSSAGKSSLGTWYLRVNDNALFDGGTIDAASITVCTAVASSTAPGFTNNNIDIAANSTSIFTSSDIEASTATETSAQQRYTIVVLPTKGSITKNGVQQGVGATFTQEDINVGNIAYVNTQTVLFTDSFHVDITNSENGWLANQVVNLEATTLSSTSFELSNLSIYPNPSTGVIDIRFVASSTDKIAIALFDLQGRRIYVSNFESNQNVFNETINVGNVANGIYLLKATQGNRSTTKRIIISK